MTCTDLLVGCIAAVVLQCTANIYVLITTINKTTIDTIRNVLNFIYLKIAFFFHFHLINAIHSAGNMIFLSFCFSPLPSPHLTSQSIISIFIYINVRMFCFIFFNFFFFPSLWVNGIPDFINVLLHILTLRWIELPLLPSLSFSFYVIPSHLGQKFYTLAQTFVIVRAEEIFLLCLCLNLNKEKPRKHWKRTC